MDIAIPRQIRSYLPPSNKSPQKAQNPEKIKGKHHNKLCGRVRIAFPMHFSRYAVLLCFLYLLYVMYVKRVPYLLYVVTRPDRIMSLFKPAFNALLPFPHVPTKYNTCWLLINEEVHVFRLKRK